MKVVAWLTRSNQKLRRMANPFGLSNWQDSNQCLAEESFGHPHQATELYDEDAAANVRVLMVAMLLQQRELFSMSNIDGLIGGASLKLDEYLKIVNYEA